MKIIDLETYPRRSHYEFFRSVAYPYVGLTANVDVTNLLAFAKKAGGSGFLALYRTAKAKCGKAEQGKGKGEINGGAHYHFHGTVETEHQQCRKQGGTQGVEGTVFLRASQEGPEA